jgi:hypothetical protein
MIGPMPLTWALVVVYAIFFVLIHRVVTGGRR